MIRIGTHVIVSVMLGSYNVQAPDVRPGIDSVVAAFDKYQVVLLGEVHGNAQQHRFIQELLRDARLPGKVDDIAIEAGNSLYQPIIDRYVGGDEVPRDSLMLRVSGTTLTARSSQVLWPSPVTMLRKVNGKIGPNELLLPVFGQDQLELITSLAKEARASCT